MKTRSALRWISPELHLHFDGTVSVFEVVVSGFHDTIGLFESTVVNGIAAEKRLSDFLHFPGPVVALQFAKFAPRAIVRNLQTGNYEAYRISVTCGG